MEKISKGIPDIGAYSFYHDSPLDVAELETLWRPADRRREHSFYGYRTPFAGA